MTDNLIIEKTLITFPESQHLYAKMLGLQKYKKVDDLFAQLLYDESLGMLIQRANASILPATLSGPSAHTSEQSGANKTGKIVKTIETNHPKNAKSKPTFQYSHGGGNPYQQNPPFNRKHTWKPFICQEDRGKRSVFKANPIICHRCGTKGHVVKFCHTPIHLVQAYQEVQKRNSSNLAIGDISGSNMYVDSNDEENFFPSVSYSSLDDNFFAGQEILLDSGATHSIFNSKIFFTSLKGQEGSIKTMESSGCAKIIGEGEVKLILNNSIEIFIKGALFVPSARNNLLSFHDLDKNKICVLMKDSMLTLKNKWKIIYVRILGCT